MRKKDKVVFGILGSLIVLHAAFRMNGNDMIIQIAMGVIVAIFPLMKNAKG